MHGRDGPAACTYLGIDISAEFLDLAKQNLLKACSGLREDRVELVQAEYMDGVQKARNRCDICGTSQKEA